MTLVLNEIHTLNGFNRSFIVAAADRRLSNQNGSYHATRTKLFPIPYLQGAISYFGIAAIKLRHKNDLYLSDWLSAFIRNNARCDDLKSFSINLRDELSRVVTANILRQYVSGFHICGYDTSGIPDFWFFSNIAERKDYSYTPKDEYDAPSSHFLDRDAIEEGWNGSDKTSISNHIRSYRNGDFMAHVAAWEDLDKIFTKLAKFPDFAIPTEYKEYKKYVKFKFEIIAYFYKNWAKKQIIGRPIDVLLMTSDGYIN